MVINVIRGQELKIIYPLFLDIENPTDIHQETIEETFVSNFTYENEIILSMSLAKITFYDTKKKEIITFDNIASADFLRIGIQMDVPDPVPSGYVPVEEWGLRLILDEYPELPDGESNFVIQIIDTEGNIYATENGTISISEPA